MTWAELDNEMNFKIVHELEENKKSPIQIMLDAGVTPSDYWLKSMQAAQRLLERIKANLPAPGEWLVDGTAAYLVVLKRYAY